MPGSIRIPATASKIGITELPRRNKRFMVTSLTFRNHSTPVWKSPSTRRMERGDGFSLSLVPYFDGLWCRIQFDGAAFFLEVAFGFFREFHVPY